MTGLTTIGNATVVVRDKDVVLVTDPWMGESDDAYFGSWNLSYKIPEEVQAEISSAKYVWFSHGHPDHLNPHSIHRFVGKKIILPDHVGGRIKQELAQMGFDVDVLPDRKWVKLSDKVRIFCITTVIQDAILLLDINGRLFVNCNDAGSPGCTRLIRKIANQYENSYLLSLSGYGDADMIHFYDEQGNFIPPVEADKPKPRVGHQLSLKAKSLGLNHIIPFSSFHRYQREDSIWANEYVTPLHAYKEGVHADLTFILPFSRVDCVSGEINPIDVRENPLTIRPPKLYGDNWNEELDKGDIKKIEAYFKRKDKVNEFLSFINFRVGGKDNIVRLDGAQKKGITFEVPRNSLMAAIDYEIFDDLLIGNFMKTTLHNMRSLYDGDFSFYVAKYGDNGRAQSTEELERYFHEYRRRIGKEYFYELFVDKATRLARRFVPQSRNSPLFLAARRIYYAVR